jgi:hypothetical protein
VRAVFILLAGRAPLNVAADFGFHSREAIVSLDKFYCSIDSRMFVY